ncbi:MAG TPA: alpha/beta hydrolase [Thermoleophilaceae bacterium]|jgi:pimeloyl-ACP methyl ester carboxylesterase
MDASAQIAERRGEVAGTSVTWLEAEPAGPGAPVLYLHGVPTSARDWRPFLERTGGYALDLPGFGRSSKSAAFDYSIPGYSRFLHGFAEHLGLERLSLLVHDWGAVGLALAQDRPESVERLVVMDAVPFLPGYRWHQTARIWRTPVLGELSMGFATKWGAKRLGRRMGTLPQRDLDGWVEENWPFFDHGTQRAILKLYRSAPSDVLARAGERLGDLTAPALVLWGERDPFLPTRFAHAYGEALGGEARVEIVERAGHWPWLDRPEVVDTIAGFLMGSPARR